MKNKDEVLKNDVIGYMNLASKHGIDSFYMKKGDFVLEFGKQNTPVQMVQPQIQTQPLMQMSQAIEKTVETDVSPEKIPENIKIINSPITGTFYQSPTPDSEAFVKIGDQIGDGTILCIVEAMKLMNEIKAEFSGKIVNILVKNEDVIEQNQPLFHIEV